MATSTYSFTGRARQFRCADAARRMVGRRDRRARRFSNWRCRQSRGASTWHLFDQLRLSHDRASTVFDTMQRARLVLLGVVHGGRGLSQLSSRIPVRLSKRGAAMAMGPDEMVNLESVKVGTDKRSAASAKTNSSHANGRTRSKPRLSIAGLISIARCKRAAITSPLRLAAAATSASGKARRSADRCCSSG